MSNKVILYIGKVRSGKTTLLFENLKKINLNKTRIILVSPSINQPLYDENIKMFFKLYDDVDDNTIEDILKTRNEEEKYNFIVIFDDLGSSKYLRRDRSLLQKMINNCRHLKIDLVFLLQKATQANTTLRENSTIIYLFKLTGRNNRKLVIEDFLSDLSIENANKILKYAWSQPYGYLKIVQEKGGETFYIVNNEIIKEKTLLSHEIKIK